MLRNLAPSRMEHSEAEVGSESGGQTQQSEQTWEHRYRAAFPGPSFWSYVLDLTPVTTPSNVHVEVVRVFSPFYYVTEDSQLEIDIVSSNHVISTGNDSERWGDSINLPRSPIYCEVPLPRQIGSLEVSPPMWGSFQPPVNHTVAKLHGRVFYAHNTTFSPTNRWSAFPVKETIGGLHGRKLYAFIRLRHYGNSPFSVPLMIQVVEGSRELSGSSKD
ncbi:hypothetical protein V8E54_006282 [Elaphomyces granulatus]